ncbi:MAG: hypothetical protein WC623_07210 [Pedobacter sp.]|uniref:hypothetical protein n=1 Tax=Pedobacter sp. TaxID=1411316 RepID=UPI00356303AF
MPEAEFEKTLCWYISTDDTFNSKNNCKAESIDDKIVILKKGIKIVAIDKDDQFITFEFEDGVEHIDVYAQLQEMVQKFIIDPYNPPI